MSFEREKARAREREKRDSERETARERERERAKERDSERERECERERARLLPRRPFASPKKSLDDGSKKTLSLCLSLSTRLLAVSEQKHKKAEATHHRAAVGQGQSGESLDENREVVVEHRDRGRALLF